MNPYDPCIWNEIINNSQIALLFHIDDILMVHYKASVVTEYVRKFNKMHRSINPLIVIREKYYKYLKMTLDFK